MKPTFTPSLFFKHATCPHWIWHDRFSDPEKKGETPALMEKLLEQGVLHEEEYVKDLEFDSVADVPAKDAFAHTLKLMQDGAELIYQGQSNSTTVQLSTLVGQTYLRNARGSRSSATIIMRQWISKAQTTSKKNSGCN